MFLLIISLVTGRNYIGAYLDGRRHKDQQTDDRPVQESAAEHRSAQLVSFVLDDAQKTWTQILGQHGVQVQACQAGALSQLHAVGMRTAQSATGPYCPGDERVYIDLGFWDDLAKFGGSTADFARRT